MTTQMTSARRGVATDEMKQVAKDEDVSLDWLIPKIAKAVLAGAGADAFSLAQNNGKAAKQIIPHVHIHIIPRYNNKGTVWTKRQIPSDDMLSELAAKIRSTLI